MTATTTNYWIQATIGYRAMRRAHERLIVSVREMGGIIELVGDQELLVTFPRKEKR